MRKDNAPRLMASWTTNSLFECSGLSKGTLGMIKQEIPDADEQREGCMLRVRRERETQVLWSLRIPAAWVAVSHRRTVDDWAPVCWNLAGSVVGRAETWPKADKTIVASNAGVGRGLNPGCRGAGFLACSVDAIRRPG